MNELPKPVQRYINFLEENQEAICEAAKTEGKKEGRKELLESLRNYERKLQLADRLTPQIGQPMAALEVTNPTRSWDAQEVAQKVTQELREIIDGLKKDLTP